jgi:hypothetical protein
VEKQTAYVLLLMAPALLMFACGFLSCEGPDQGDGGFCMTPIWSGLALFLCTTLPRRAAMPLAAWAVVGFVGFPFGLLSVTACDGWTRMWHPRSGSYTLWGMPMTDAQCAAVDARSYIGHVVVYGIWVVLLPVLVVAVNGFWTLYDARHPPGPDGRS